MPAEPQQPAPPLARRYRFGAFEADAATGELRRQGLRIKLNAQPFQVLLLLLARPGDLLTREEIAGHLWPTDTFVDFDHGLNSAINRIREALNDPAASPRFLETLPRRGYRFIAPVEAIPNSTAEIRARSTPTEVPLPESAPRTTLLATEQDLPRTPHRVVRTLFLLLQLMYVAFYVGALANLREIDDLFSPLPHATEAFLLLIVTAALLIPVRAFILSATLFRAPRARQKLLQLWPFVLPFDALWSLAPFLLLHHINFGLALACTALLLYSPLAQRSLILMGSGDAP